MSEAFEATSDGMEPAEHASRSSAGRSSSAPSRARSRSCSTRARQLGRARGGEEEPARGGKSDPAAAVPRVTRAWPRWLPLRL